MPQAFTAFDGGPAPIFVDLDLALYVVLHVDVVNLAKKVGQTAVHLLGIDNRTEVDPY